MNPIDPESLIYRFAKQLEFGPATMPVAGEAVRIVQRMNRDWMTTGRRPAGLCGAALILAARMNNFRRTIREVVYVVKVTEITISQRLAEFGATESGDLTVDQFRSVQLENTHDPPSFTRAREGRKPRHATKRRKLRETAADIEYDSAGESETESTQPRRIDSDGFAIPDRPIDPSLAESTHRRRYITEAVNEVIEDAKQETKSHRTSYPAPSAEQIESENALEDEMRAMLAQGSSMIESVIPSDSKSKVSDNVDIDQKEFEDDPEVANCLLSPAEVDIKEHIWVHENKEYLRTQQAKALKQALAQATAGPSSHKPRKRRKGRLGDVTYLEGNGEDGDNRSSRASTPAEATRRMLERRGYSKKINYSLLDTLYGSEETKDPEKAKLESRSRSQSRSMSVASRRSASVASEITPRRVNRLASVTASKRSHPRPSASTPQATLPPVAPPPPITTEPLEKDPKPTNDDHEIVPDPDELEDDDEDDVADDHVDEAFAGTYEDYYAADSDYDYDD